MLHLQFSEGSWHRNARLKNKLGSFREAQRRTWSCYPKNTSLLKNLQSRESFTPEMNLLFTQQWQVHPTLSQGTRDWVPSAWIPMTRCLGLYVCLLSNQTSTLILLFVFLLYIVYTYPGRSLEKEMATLSSILAWRIPRTEEPGGL